MGRQGAPRPTLLFGGTVTLRCVYRLLSYVRAPRLVYMRPYAETLGPGAWLADLDADAVVACRLLEIVVANAGIRGAVRRRSGPEDQRDEDGANVHGRSLDQGCGFCACGRVDAAYKFVPADT